MSETKKDSPKTFIKAKVGQVSAFKSPSRFGGGGAPNQNKIQSQFKPQAVRVTQHKG